MPKFFFRDFFQSEIKIKVLLLLISILAYWQISLLQYSIKWDMLDVILPWRFYIGECLRNFCFPLWNPYQSAGYPIHADLQCPTWYPETILIGSTFGYSNITLHFLFVMYIFIAGLGIYGLTKYFGTDKLPAFVSGAAFMLSGIFISHTQHLFIIVSLAWLPWCILYYIKISVEPFSLKNVLILSILTFLLISGGYQTISIASAYLFFIFFAFYCIKALKSRNWHSFLVILKSNLFWIVLTTGLCLVIISSLPNSFRFVERLSGISLAETQSMPFTPRSLISILVPFAAAEDPGFFKTDISMTNLYPGIFMLGFFLAGLFIKLKPELKILLIYTFILLLASFGNWLPVREWMYKYIPLMNLFRIPGFLRVMILIPVVITGGLAIDSLIKGTGNIRKWIHISLLFIGISLVAMLMWSIYESAGGQSQSAYNSVYTRVRTHSIIQLSFLLIYIILYFKKISLRILIPAFVCTEMILAVQLNIMHTGCLPDYKPLVIRIELKERPQGFPMPPPSDIYKNTDAVAGFEPLWRNVNIFNKTVSFDAFTSFKLKGYKYLEDEIPSLKDSILKNRLVYLSSQIYNKDEQYRDKMKLFQPKDLFFSSQDYIELEKSKLESSPEDSVFLTGFNPNEIRAIVKTKYNQVVTLIQSNYPGWKVFIDGKSVSHYTSNSLFISALIPAGGHEVIFRFNNRFVKASFIFSYSLLAIMIFMLLWKYLTTKYSKPIRIFIPFLLLFIVLLSSVLSLNNYRKNLSDRTYSEYARAAIDHEKKSKENTRYLFIMDNPEKLARIMNENGNPIKYIAYNHDSPAVCTQLWDDLTSYPIENMIIALINVRSRPEIFYILNKFYPEIKKLNSTCTSTLLQLSNNPAAKGKLLYSTFYDFEGVNEEWTANNAYLDSSISCSGKFSERLDSVNKFSSTLNVLCSKLASCSTFALNISASVYNPEKVEAFIVLQIKRNGRSVGYYTLNISDAITEKNKWQKVFLSKYIRYHNSCKDIISVYAWNKANGTIWIDDLEVTLLKKLN